MLQTNQSGNVLVLFVISLLTLIIMAAMALDVGHLLLNKGRLQNLVDAAALHAAKEIDQGATRDQASAAAVNLLQLNLAYIDQSELARAIDLDDNDADSTAILTIEYSEFPDPFAVAGLLDDAPYVKVSLTQLSLDNFFADIFSFNKQVSATALAGPSTAIINCFTQLVPMAVCAEKNSPLPNFGLGMKKLYVMKIGSNTDSPIGPGNFQLIRLDNNSGAADIRSAMAGEDSIAQICFDDSDDNQSVPTEPGNTVGPVAQGLNTRMGQWNGPVNSTVHPRDENICQGEKITIEDDGTLEIEAINKAYSVDEYIADNIQNDNACASLTDTPSTTKLLTGNVTHTMEGVGRRIMNVVIVDCGINEATNGANNLEFLGVGCFFLTQSVEQKGQESYVIGEFLYDCPGGGDASLESDDTPGPYKMVLFHVPGSKDS